MSEMQRLTFVALIVGLAAGGALAVPVQSGGSNVITERKDFIPNRKHLPLPGKIVAVLVYGAQPALNVEGRSGPANQLCLGYAGGSYRWVYVPVEHAPMVPYMDIAVGQQGEKKRFQNLSLASPEVVKPLGIDALYALVEVEVNAGLGSPAGDSLVATRMKQLDGTPEFPLKVQEIISDLTRRYQDYLKEQRREIDTGMEQAATAAIKERRATGPRERNDLMFITWMPDTERLRVHFRSIITDGDYKYDGGINIEFGNPQRIVTAAPGRGAMPAGRLPNGLRYGRQFGIEFGMAYEVSKAGKLEGTRTLPIEIFQREIASPNLIGRGAPTTGAARTRAIKLK
jgi:hypothetical protein